MKHGINPPRPVEVDLMRQHTSSTPMDSFDEKMPSGKPPAMPKAPSMPKVPGTSVNVKKPKPPSARLKALNGM